jgi:hypothetical protein
LGTDASNFGWGAALTTGDHTTPDRLATAHLLGRGTFNQPDASQWAFEREFDAVIHAVDLFSAHIGNSYVRLLCDNSTVVATINSNHSSSAAVNNKLTLLNTKLRAYNCSIIATHVAGASHRTADELSRTSLEDDRTINPAVIKELETAFSKVTIDRFATYNNRVTTLYNSYFME